MTFLMDASLTPGIPIHLKKSSALRLGMAGVYTRAQRNKHSFPLPVPVGSKKKGNHESFAYIYFFGFRCQ